MKHTILESIENIKNLDSSSFFLLAGPCIIEDEKSPFEIAERLIEITDKLKIPFIFKSSYKKANRQKIDSFTGIGDEKALKVLRTIKEVFEIPIVTDIHSEEDAVMVSQIADIIQIPAFLCRQTDLLTTAARTGRVINIKKGQFVSPESIKFAAQKVVDSGNNNVMLTERGTMFGYNDLIVDFRGIIEMQKTGFPVIIDITHSLQQPNLASGISGGRPELIETIGRAGIAVGADGVFIETHPNPSVAKSDGANMLRLDLLEDLLKRLLEIKHTINKFH